MSKEVPLVSVIVPVYNVEKYVEECLESIKNQTYSNIEVLMVNDGSTDKSPEICKEYEKQDKRFKLFNKKNGGLSDARNYGLDRIKGEYVCFVDGDDTIGCEFVEKMADALWKNSECSIACCRYARFQNLDEISKETIEEYKVFDSREYLIDTLYQHDQTLNTVSVCTKMFKSSIFEEFRFPEGVLYEDLASVGDIMKCGEKIILVDSVQYCYRATPDSITTGKFNWNKMVMLRHCEELLKRYKDDNELESAVIAMLFARSFELLLLMKNSKAKDEVALTKLWNNIRKYRKEIILDGSVRLFVRCSALLSFFGINISAGILSFVKYRCIL